MKNKNLKLEHIFNLYYVQLILVLGIICFLIAISLALMQDINRGNNIIDSYNMIKSLYVSAILGGAVFSYSQSKKSFKFLLSFGLTRKEIFINAIKKILSLLVVTLFLSLYYIWIEKYFSGIKTSIFSLLKSQGILFLIEILVLVCLVGFCIGLLQLNSKIMYLILNILAILLWILVGKYRGDNIVNIILSILTIIMVVVDRYLVERVKVK